MPTDISEFRHLPALAEAVAASLPSVTRVEISLPDGRTLSALRYGDGDPEITLLHGAGLNAHTWDNTALRLQRPTLAIDLAGHGDSSWRTDADYSPRLLAADVALALAEWTTRPQIVVGQSLGGLTASAVAGIHPDLVRAVILVDITPGIDASAGPAMLREFYRITDFASRDELVDHALSFGLGGTRADAERGVFLNSRVRADGRVEWKHHFAQLASRALPASDAPASDGARRDEGWEDLAAVVAPLTLVRAMNGFVSAADALDFRARLPHAHVVELDATHNVQETAPAALAELVLDAVDSE